MIVFLKSMIKVSAHDRAGVTVKEHFRRAAEFASDKHAGQTRKDGKTPYIQHPVRVAYILGRNGEHDPVVMIAALLHDTIEDTGVTRDEIADRFGDEVADLVAEVSDDMTLPKEQRRAGQESRKWSDRASRLKIADKTANMIDLMDAPPIGMKHDAKLRYAQHAKKMVDAMSHRPAKLIHQFDEAYNRIVDQK